jgi:subtilisin family serine protease
VPVPGGQYEMKSGTSFAAAYVSGIAALMLERKPQLTPDAVKKVLLSTARDLGPKGRDEQFGAGLADAFEAVTAVEKPADAALHVPAH